ncbi:MULTISPECIES: LysR substrate-binding domain-containing protein [Psychrobacter]|uniref:Transcriptional regulator n=1 Tax=Psychrobacter alimentarius TaxID=261164 RepID=A0ABM5ZXU5_9GAMM|nr:MULTISPECIES: LysR substrate-binding domain-containing protein [Psychrobacter]AMT96899.1 Putative transcriptional regulator [Psychrobacter alimentarius]QCB30747.1 LysR family transcriptional regulator [Psychrobacter sp. PAMC27889]
MPNHRSLPPLNALRAFEAAGRKLSFRAAADELFVTQGAVAQQVRILEEYIGFSLFQRLPRGVSLTSKGSVYFAEITQAFDTINKATVQLLKEPETVTISVTPAFATKILLPQLSALTAAVPDIDLRTVATESIADFDRDQVDIAVRLTDPPFPTSFETRLLFKQKLVPVASPHLIGDRTLPISLKYLRDMPLLHDSHNHWPRFFGITGKLPGAVFNQTALALDAALAGQGVAIACQAFVQADLSAGRLIQVSESDLIVEPNYYLVRKRVTASRKNVDAVWNWCIENLVTI